MSRRHRLRAAIARRDLRIGGMLFSVALVVYAVGIWWGLPHATTPERAFAWGSDELAPLGGVAELYRVFLDPNPQFNPQYPLLHYFVQAAFTIPYLGWLWLTGGLQGVSGAYPFGMADPVAALATATLLSRLPSALAGAGVVVAAWRTGRILWVSGRACSRGWRRGSPIRCSSTPGPATWT